MSQRQGCVILWAHAECCYTTFVVMSAFMGVCARRIKSARANIIAIINNVKRPAGAGGLRHTSRRAHRKSLTSVALITPMVVKDWWESSAAQGRLFLADARRERLNIPVGVRLWPATFCQLRHESLYGFPVLVAAFDNVISQHFDSYHFTGPISIPVCYSRR